MATETLSADERFKVQMLETEVLLEVNRICTKYNIPYSLTAGTLLGAVRHAGFIPWDDDIDICMFRKDYMRFQKACQTDLSPRYFYQSNQTDKEYYYLFDKIRINGTVFKETFLECYHIHHGIYIDIFPIDHLADRVTARFFQYHVFYFLRAILMAKYVNTNARKGFKKYVSKLIKFLFHFVPLRWLYQSCTRLACSSNDTVTQKVHCFGVGKKFIFDRSLFEEFQYVPFEGTMLPIHKRTKRILRKLYGNYMQLPPEQDRITRHDLSEFKLSEDPVTRCNLHYGNQ